MNSGAVFLLPAPDAARQVLEGSGACGTFSTDLAAGLLDRPAASAGRGSPSTAPSGVTIPAGPFQVAAPTPGGGGLFLVVEAPANPFQEPTWKAATIRPRSSIAFASCSKRARACARFARSTACLPARLFMHGCAVMTSSRPASGNRARSAFTPSPRKACAWHLRPLWPIRQTRRLLASLSMLSAGSWASSRSHSATSPSSRGL